MNNLCEVCNQRQFTQFCDYEESTGIITSARWQELSKPCDKKICKQCAVELWANVEVCPKHALKIKQKLEVIK
jgi:hypothetical protein